MLLGNPKTERHLDLFVDLRILLKWIGSDRNCMSWWRWRLAAAVTGFWVRRYGDAVVQSGRWGGNELVCIGPTLFHAWCAAAHTCCDRPGNTAT